MSILIKGMEMPKSCGQCPMLEGDRDDGLCHAASRWLDDEEYWLWYQYPEGDIDTSKPSNCPLVYIPSADVQPVVHGHWIVQRSNYNEKFECSVCQHISKDGGNYCSNCGARMDEVEDDDNV